MLLNGGGSFVNAGTLAKLAGSGTSTLDAALTSSGSIAVASGTLDLDGGGTITGTITGAGTLLFGGGGFSVDGSTALNVANVAIDAGSVALGSNAAFELDGAFDLASGSLVLAAGDTLVLTGTASFADGGTVDGAATLLTSGAVAIGADGSSAVFSDGLTWSNSGTVTASGLIELGGLTAVAFVNAAGGVFDLASDAAGIAELGSVSSFENDGTLAKTGGSGASAIYSSVDNLGTLIASSGTLALEFSATLGGKVGGEAGGLVLLANGATTSGTLAVTDNGSAASIQLSSSYATWSNGGTINDAGQVLLGDARNSGPAILFNASGAVWNLTGDDLGIAAFGTVMLTNAGTLAKTGGGGVSQIGCDLTNSGLIDAASGTLAVEGTVSGSGTLRIESGSTLEMGQAVQATQTIVFAGAGATLKLDHAASIAGPMQGFGAGSGIDLANASAATASISGNVLTITAGTGTYTFTSAESLSGLTAHVSGDGSGGSLVTLSAASLGLASPAFLASASPGGTPAGVPDPGVAALAPQWLAGLDATPPPAIGAMHASTIEPTQSAAMGFAAMIHAQPVSPLAFAHLQ